MAREVILVCGDLIFTSKITGTARAVGTSVRVALSIPAAIEAVTDTTDLALIDLSESCTAEQMEQLRSALPASAQMLAYGSHVDTARLDEARNAGCDPVLARSQFVEQLPDLLR